MASSTSSTACGASGSTFFITRTIFSSSPISSARFCRRPAVSISITSALSSRARVSASKASPAASAPCSRSTRSENGAPRPDPQLLDRGGAERVARGEHDRLALASELGGELADRRRLAGAVDADDEDDERALARVDLERARDRRQRALDFLGENRLHRLGRDALLVAPAPDRLANPCRRAEAEIGLDEDVLEIVERVRVELALGEDVGDAAADAGRRARQAELQPLKPASLRRRARGSGIAAGACEAQPPPAPPPRRARPSRRTSGA